MTFKSIFGALPRILAWAWHHLVWIASACILLGAATVLVLRYMVLPNIDGYRASVERSVSQAAGQRVAIGKMTADWDGLRPRLNLIDLVVYDKRGRAALKLKRVDGTMSWLSVVLWRPRFHLLDFHEPSLDIRRDAAGVISVAGIEMGGESQEGGFSDWVLNQRDIVIHNAAIDWTDEKRNAPTLRLRNVGLQLVNRGSRHRFGVKALPPAALAGPLDVRGDLTGRSLKNPADWNGRLYVQLDSPDIAAWRTWVPFPFEFSRGEGKLRAWATIKEQTLRELTADVQLSSVNTRLAQDLPPLDVPALSGRIAWKKLPARIEASLTQFEFTSAEQEHMAPLDMRYMAAIDKRGVPTGGEIRLNALDLAPVVSLAEHLPLDTETRKRLVELSPQGRLRDVTARWDGDLPRPRKYSARGHFETLAVKHTDTLPGLSGVSGTLYATEIGGTLQIKSQALKLDMPEVFKEPLEFDSVAAQASWTLGDKGFNLKLSNVAYGNKDLEGVLSGSFQSVAGAPGIADLTANLTRADARRVTRYLPLAAGRSARPWLENAFLAGSSSDVRFQLKGDLREFPFADDKNGTFSVTAKVKGGTLHYGDNWPDIEKIDGEFAFRGKRLEIVAQQGLVHDARLSGVRAEIPDLADTRILTVTGDAEGQTQSFLKFIAASPVSGYIDHFTDGMQAEGAGRLNLRLELPLRELARTRVSGGYQMTGNRLLLEPSLPPLEQATGKLEFTEAGVTIPSATATFSGGPLTIAGSTQRDGTIRMDLAGRVNSDVMRGANAPGWLSQVSGSTDWRGTVTVRKKTADLVLESNLQGVASSLPAPFFKSAPDALPLRVERRFVSQDHDRIAITLGDVLSARLLRHVEGTRTIVDRGTVRLGGSVAGEPEQNGVFVSGNLKSLNLDAWLKLAGTKAATEGDIGFKLAGLDINLGEFELHDRKFGELSIAASATTNSETMRYRLQGREIDGIADWNPQGRGRLVAQLQKLILPASSTATPQLSARDRNAVEETAQLPALDVMAENFQIGSKPMGRLELKASQQNRDWRIEKLQLTSADGVLSADGVWQSWLSNPRTQMNVKWDVLDVGNALTRLGYPGGMRRGIAQIGGTLAWNGSPQQIDYASLSGKFALRAANGQFVKMEPGIGKLLGIISLQSIPRRLNLDFRDVFSEGFAFDEILGEIAIDRGVAVSEKFLITGPAAKVLMSGSVDLNRETQNLQVKVSPHVSEGVTIATGLLTGPIGALAAFVGQRLFKDPFDNLVSFRYSVTGSWADPVVRKIDALAPAAPVNVQ